MAASNKSTEVEKTFDVSSILYSETRDYLIRNNRDQVKSDHLNGKIVGLYFSAPWCGRCRRFTDNLIKVYNELKSANNFEIVFVTVDEDKVAFKVYFSKMPWLAVPFPDTQTRDRLDELFAVDGIPHLSILDENGKVLTHGGVQVIQEYGAAGFPFTSEQIAKLKEQEEEAKRNQSLRSILVSQSRDYVIAADGHKVLVSDLVGKTVLLYFSAKWGVPCRVFLPILTKTYQEINENAKVVEVVFISLDEDQPSFDEFFSTMPWLALPFCDPLKQSLSRLFKVRSIPMVIAIGPNGKTVSTEAFIPILCYGPDAYPFTPEHMKEVEAAYEKMADEWPKKLKCAGHDDELFLTQRLPFVCDGCNEEGRVWSYRCEECNYDLHPKCALGGDGKGKGSDMIGGEDEGKGGEA